MFFKNLISASPILAFCLPVSPNHIVNYKCDGWARTNEEIWFKEKRADIFKQLYVLFDYNYYNYFTTTKTDKFPYEIGKIGDYVTAEQLGIYWDNNPKNLKTDQAEQILGKKISLDISLIRISLRIHKINEKKGLILATRKVEYKDFCFDYWIDFKINGYKT